MNLKVAAIILVTTFSLPIAVQGSDWQGISGAPVFVEDYLVGIIRSVPESFDGKRLKATPAYRLLEKNEFYKIVDFPKKVSVPAGQKDEKQNTVQRIVNAGTVGIVDLRGADLTGSTISEITGLKIGSLTKEGNGKV